MSNHALKAARTLEIASKTDPGLLRSLNEDSISVDRENALMVLSDGMGGYQCGDVASKLATQVVIEGVTQGLKGKTRDAATASAVVEDVIKRANRAIFLEGKHRAQSESTGKDQPMGATLALLLFRDKQAILAHVGDSRIYRLRDAQLELLTHDHSLLQEQIDLGILSAEAAASSHNRHLVTRGLGLQAEVEVAIDVIETRSDDVYLICSDGLNDMVDNRDIELALRALQANLPLAASQLVMIANDNGGEDNISVILAKTGGQPETPNTTKKSFLDWLFGR